MTASSPDAKELFRTDNLRVESWSDTTAVLWLHVAGKSLNVINHPLLADLEAALKHLNGRMACQGLIIASDRATGFLAGADVHEFTTLRGSTEAEAFAAAGQQLFDRLAQSRLTSVALVRGPCLGGGLELALACDHRVAVADPKTVFSFPEIQLGLLPAWGGTQRLPRVVGLERALQMILGNHRLNAQQSLRWGLVDALVSLPSEATLPPKAELEPLLTRGKRPRASLPLRTWRQRFLESTSLGRALIFRGTERLLRRRVPDDMPAPREALEAVRTGIKQGLPAGLEYERRAAGRLGVTLACRNLVRLFLQREEARKPLAGGDGSPPVRRVGIVGAGTMGAGIAQLAALRGCEIVLHEVNADALGAGLFRVAALFEKAVEHGLLAREDAQQKMAAIRGTIRMEGFEQMDLVVEAVVEDLDSKRRVFRELEEHTRPATILATNTSSLRIAHLQEGLQHPERVAGLHFFNPVHKMPLVEVVRGAATRDAVLEVLVRWSAALGKTPVCVGDGPGFVVNRILTPYLNEAVLLLGEGLRIDAIDGVMRRFGMPMGPLELLDQVGLDVASHIAKSIQPAFAHRFAPNSAFASMTQQGWLGQKTRVGFYLYHRGKKRVNSAAAQLLRAAGTPRSLTPALPMPVRLQQARERLVLLMVNEAAMCLGEGLAKDAGKIDLAMVMGTGWAPHRGGPLRYAEDRSPEEIVRVLAELAQQLGPRFEPCRELRQWRVEGGSTSPQR